MSQVYYCPRNPKNETNLRCSRCEEFICPDCMVQTPVGARCPTCARSTPIPTYNVTPAFMARGIAAGLATALLLGGAFMYVTPRFLFIVLIPRGIYVVIIAVLAAGIGYFIGETVSLSVNRKKGKSLKYISSGCMLIASLPITFAMTNIFGQLSLVLIIGIAAAFWLSIRRF